jgi:cell division protein FtsW
MSTRTTRRTAAEPANLRTERTRRSRDRTDVSIVLTALGLLVIGLVMSLSASSIRSAENTGSAFTLFGRQLIWAILGVGALLFFWRFDYRKLRGLTYALVPISWVLLLATRIPGLGVSAGGASRWIAVGSFQLQPSEFAKLAMILFGADVLSRKQGRLDDWRHIAIPYFAATGVTCLLVLVQPDFGTAMIIGITSLAIAYLAGSDVRALAGMTAVAAIVGVPLMFGASYRFHRFFGFLGKGRDCLGSAYQTCQGLVALGSGRWFGLGLGSGRAKYAFLPNADTDYIFAIVGEETGLIGTLTILVLFALQLILGIRAARRARDPFGFLLASGITAWITLQLLINVGAVTGLMPITGVPMPLISFGGTSLLASLAGLGIVASVARRGRAPARLAE